MMRIRAPVVRVFDRGDTTTVVGATGTRTFDGDAAALVRAVLEIHGMPCDRARLFAELAAARGGDVPALLAHVWLHELGSRRRVEELGPAAVAALTTAPWPRNLDSLRESAPRLLALVEHGTIRAAAAALGLTRQALASALGRLGVIGP